jgi:hypoxia up-regulated 1
MWNWSTRLFLTEAKQNLTLDGAEGLTPRYTLAELDTLEKSLIAHESWLNLNVEAQKKRQYNEDPAVETAEMKRRAEELANQLGKLARRKIPPKPKKSPTATSSSAASTATSESPVPEPTSTSTTSATASARDRHDEL